MSSVISFEISRALSRPVELYKFDIGGEIYTYTSRSRDYAAPDGNLYKAARIKREDVIRSSTNNEGSLSIEVSRDFPIANMFKSAIPGANIDLIIYRTHKNAGTQDYLWSGRVSSCDFTDSKATLFCEDHMHVLDSFVMRKTYQINCSHALYSEECGVNIEDHKRIKTISNIDTLGVVYESDDFYEPPGLFVGGILEVGGVKRTILAYDNVANTVTITAPILGAKAGDTMNVYRGCDRRHTTCKTDFNNGDNFFGFPYVPVENPFQKTIEE